MNNTRKIVEYNQHDMEYIINTSKEIWCNRVKQMTDSEIDEEIRLIRYDSSIKIARKIVSLYNSTPLSLVATLIIAPTQSGKTSIAFEICDTMISNYFIPTDNIYIITGLSSSAWVKQTSERFPDCIKENIIHRDKLNELFIERLKNKRNILIIIDEIHIASYEDTKLFKALSFIQDINYLYNNDIKLIEVSATPDGILSSLKEWDTSSFHIEKYNPGENYVGVKKLYDGGKILQYKDLMIEKNILYLNNIIINKYKNNYKYHLIRLPKKYDIFVNHIKEYLDKQTFRYDKYDEKNNPGDINIILKIKPLQHTIIFIKEMLRCSKTMYKEHIGILYERYTTNPNSSAIIQGFLGRNTGYDINDESIVFTDLNTVISYIKLIENENLSYDNIKQWNSRSLKINNDKIIRKKDINANISRKEDIPAKVHKDWEPDYYPLDYATKKYTQEEVITGFTQLMFEHGIKVKPKMHTKNNDGFYLQIIRGSIPKILSINDVKNEKKQGINNKNKYRFYACYKDVNDPDTITWIFYYKI